MTHNLPQEAREHFQEQNKRYVEAKGLEDILCPVFIHIRKEGVIVYDLIAYGYSSNSCMDCKGRDKTCELYQDYIDRANNPK